MFELRFPLARIPELEQFYWDKSKATDITRETRVETEIAPFMRQNHYLTREHFRYLAYWKSPRSQSRCAKNEEGFVEAVTAIALTTDDKRLRIEVLTLLSGVSWPTASVILHFGYDNLYPILDVNALWSAGIDDVARLSYNFELWSEYTSFCRQMAGEAGVSMRKLDRALWAYADKAHARP